MKRKVNTTLAVVVVSYLILCGIQIGAFLHLCGDVHILFTGAVWLVFPSLLWALLVPVLSLGLILWIWRKKRPVLFAFTVILAILSLVICWYNLTAIALAATSPYPSGL